MKNKILFSLLFVFMFSFSFTASAYNFGTTTLKNGSKGEAVMELQRFLNATLNLGLVVDGK
ncbi:MAG: Peptidoglycan-binding protein, partial [Patescibacteria group bacterium]|nr:Peptidoglycan-binding protein [Patescibacteria group bacterium]